jgi:hypothetical protein
MASFSSAWARTLLARLVLRVPLVQRVQRARLERRALQEWQALRARLVRPELD